MKLGLTCIAVTELIAVAGAAVAAPAGAPITGGILGSGQIDLRLQQHRPLKERWLLMEWAKVAPGASFGWHLHKTAIAVVITAGTLTLYDSKDRSCRPRRYSKGQGFVEPANNVHIARNEVRAPSRST